MPVEDSSEFGGRRLFFGVNGCLVLDCGDALVFSEMKISVKGLAGRRHFMPFGVNGCLVLDFGEALVFRK